MAGSVVQVKTAVANTGTSPASVTLDTAATAGNTLVIIYGGDDYVTSGNRPSGTSEPTGGRQETFLGHYVWYKTAAGGETTLSATPNAPATWVMIALELSGVGTLNVSNGQLVSSGGNTYTTPTVTPTAGARYAVATIGGSLNANFNTGMGAWTNSFTEAADAATTLGSGTRDNVGVATRSFTADGVAGVSTGVTWDGALSPQSRTGVILVFTEAAAGTSAPAGAATGTAAANAATITLTADAAATTATGTSPAAVASTGAGASPASGAGTAEWDAGSSISLDLIADNPVDAVGTAFDAIAGAGGLPGAATATGVAHDATPAIAATAAGTTAVGSAADATTSTSSAANASAAEATGTASAADAAAAVTVAAAQAAGFGTAADATPAAAAIAGLATATGQAADATASTAATTNADAGVAAASGIAIDPVAAVQVLAAAAAAIAEAPDAAVLTGGPGQVSAGTASGSGQASDPRVRKLIPRPFTGITSRPFAGTTLRP